MFYIRLMLSSRASDYYMTILLKTKWSHFDTNLEIFYNTLYYILYQVFVNICLAAISFPIVLASYFLSLILVFFDFDK